MTIIPSYTALHKPVNVSHVSYNTSLKADRGILSILQMRKLKHKVIKQFA